MCFLDVPRLAVSVVPGWFLGQEGDVDGKRITKRLVDGLSAHTSEYFVWDSDLQASGCACSRRAL